MGRIEKRDKRVDLHLPVDVSGEDAMGRPFAETTRTINVSGSGIGFESDQPLLVGARLMVDIALPPPLRKHFGGQERYKAQAVITRIEKYEGDTHARVGARFTKSS